MLLVRFTLLLTFTGGLFAEISVQPNPPITGETAIVRAGLEFAGVPLYPGDRVFSLLLSHHSGIYRQAWTEMRWDGTGSTAEIIIPPDCQWLTLSLATPERHVGSQWPDHPPDAGR